MAFAGPKIWPALLLAAAEEVLRPASVDCWDRPDWADFRQKAQGFARQGWPKADAELEAMSRALVEKWRWVVCKEDCRTTEHLTWFFVEDWGAKCSESANFDRYLVTHYFRNRGLSYSARKSEYCHFGFITALVITAHFEFPNSVSKAGRLLFLAFVLLGDFLAFDWLSSSSWPVDSLMILLNVHMVSQELITGSQLEFVRAQGQLPGVRGAAFLREQSRWLGTSEAAKPVARGSFSRTLRIWQLDAHTALAGEAKTMLTRFGDEVEVQFLGNSLASNVCRNYDLCPSGEDKELLQKLLDRYYRAKEPFLVAKRGFEEALGDRLSREADVLMCSQPLFWCRFLLGLQKPLLLYVGLPVMWDLREEDKEGWAEDFFRILRGDRHVVIAMSVFTARAVHWQFGAGIPVLRFLGLHSNAHFAPWRNESVLVSRFGTSGALSECMLDSFAAANRHWFPLRFVQMEAVLFEEHLARTQSEAYGNAKSWKDHTAEIKVPGMPYAKLVSHRAAICLPYDITIFLFHELYSANMPLFVPKDLWRWLIGPHTSPQMEFRHPGADEDVSRPRSSPFYASIHRPMGVEQALEWSTFSDWAMLPQVFYFQGVPDLFLQLMDAEALHDASAKMRAFNDEELISAVQNWRRVAQRLAFAVTGETGDDACKEP
ncbi:unnamed protein product, partial [Effrenium voratum]